MTPLTDNPDDLRWIGPTHECPRCAGHLFTAVVQVDPTTNEVSAYLLDVTCWGCGSLVKLVCPADPIIPLELPDVQDGEGDGGGCLVAV